MKTVTIAGEMPPHRANGRGLADHRPRTVRGYPPAYTKFIGEQFLAQQEVAV